MFSLDAVYEYKKRRQSRLDAKAVYDYRERRDQRWIARMDAEEDENLNNVGGGSGGHGNTKIPFGLCLREGINVDPKWTPKDAWKALEGKGYSAGEVYKELKSTGKVPQKSSGKPRMSKEQSDKAIKDYEGKTKELKKLEAAQKKAEKEVTKAIADRSRAYGEDAVREAAKKVNEAMEKNEELKRKREQIVSEQKGMKEAYKQAVMESPEYELARKYMGEEEQVRMTQSFLESNEEKIKKLRTFCAVYEHNMNAYQEKAEIAPTEGLKELNEKYAREYAEKVADTKDRIQKAENSIEPLRQRVAANERRMNEAKSGASDESAWSRAYDVAREDSIVEESKYTNLDSYAKRMKSVGVKYDNVRRYVNKPTEEGIIQYVAGGDLTGGSCASVSCAYLAQKAGYEVLDYRGGQSQGTFSADCVSFMHKMGGTVAEEYNDFTASKKLLEGVEEGKEYWFCTGSHAAVVRKKDGKIQYLELQSAMTNGWFPLTEGALKNRFSAKKSHSVYGTKIRGKSVIIDSEKLVNNEEFISFLGYINTASDKQKKGAKGGRK